MRLPSSRIATLIASSGTPRSALSTARRRSVRGVFGLAAAAALAASSHAQTWTRVTQNSPAAANLLLLLSDGTVMASNNDGSTIGHAWYRLTPDIHGSYVNGTWTTLAAAHDTRLYYSSQVLRDGRVFIAGGEYGTGAARAEVYDPATNVWTALPIPTTVLNPSATSPATGGNQAFIDSISMLLPNGNVFICPVAPNVNGGTVIYDPVANVWSNGPHLFRGVFQDESSWVKLPDDSILTIDPFGVNSERFIPSQNMWVNDSNVPVSLYDPFGEELGAAFLLPGGHAFFLGSTGHTALYAPTGNTSPGVWTAGPDIPAAHGTPDAPAAMMANGHILCAVSPVPTSANHFPPPTTFYDYDPVSNSFSSAASPPGANLNQPSYQCIMLDLPDGSVLFSHFATDLYVFNPAGPQLAAGKPTVTSVTPNPDGSHHLTGMGINGISQGAAYGDDFQMATNYPIVRVTDQGTGNVYYAKTYNWSSTGVMTGNQPVTVDYQLPASLPPGGHTMVVIANGIASDPFSDSAVVISLPNGAPTVMPPSVPANIAVNVSPGSQQVSGTPQMFYRTNSGSSFSSVALVPQGNNNYTATFPAPHCGDSPEFYFSAMGDQGATVNLPFDAPTTTFHATVETLYNRFTDAFETDLGWSGAAPDDDATAGRWTRNVSQGTAAQPQGNHTANGTMCWVTDYHAGTSTGQFCVQNGKTTLTSPRLDPTNLPNPTISYWRWYSNGVGTVNPHTNVFFVDISNNDGATWTNVETVGPSGPDTNGGWILHSFNPSDFIDLTANVRVRFVAVNYFNSIVEAAIDDFALTGSDCVNSTPCYANCDQSTATPFLNVNDFICFQSRFAAGDTYANCDNSTTPPILNVNDFICFQSQFAAGCSAP